MTGPVSRKLHDLRHYLASRAAGHDPLSTAEMEQMADVLGLMISYVEAMEGRPVPQSMRVPPWQVIEGGRRQTPGVPRAPIVPTRRSEPQGLPPKGAA